MAACGGPQLPAGLFSNPIGVCLLQVLMVVFDILLSHHRMTKWHEQRVQHHLQDMAVLQAAVAQQEERLHSHAAASTSQVGQAVWDACIVLAIVASARPSCACMFPGQQLKQCTLTAALRVSSVIVAVDQQEVALVVLSRGGPAGSKSAVRITCASHLASR